MKSLFLLFISILCGCSSYRNESFSFTRFSPSNEMQAVPQIKALGKKSKGIPFVFKRDTKGAPYNLELCFLSEIEPKAAVTLSKVIFTNTEGKTHQLLSKEARITSFKKRNKGPYIRRERFEAVWISFNLPVTFIHPQTCTVEVEFTFKEKAYKKKWNIGTRLDKGFTNLMSEMLKY